MDYGDYDCDRYDAYYNNYDYAAYKLSINYFVKVHNQHLF